MKKVLAILLAMIMVFAFTACGEKEPEVKVDPNSKDEGVMTFAEYVAAEEGSDVVIEGFITAKVYAQAYGNCNLFVQDGDGAYFVYRMPCTDDDDAKLAIGAKVKISGVKTSWSGEVELKEGSATYEVVGEDRYEFDAVDVTEKLASDDLINYQNMKVKVTSATVKSAALYKWDGSGDKGDDLYLGLTIGGADYTFVVESDVCDGESETYKAVEALTEGQTIDIEGLMYWYNGPQMWMTSVTVK